MFTRLLVFLALFTISVKACSGEGVGGLSLNLIQTVFLLPEVSPMSVLVPLDC